MRSQSSREDRKKTDKKQTNTDAKQFEINYGYGKKINDQIHFSGNPNSPVIYTNWKVQIPKTPALPRHGF